MFHMSQGDTMVHMFTAGAQPAIKWRPYDYPKNRWVRFAPKARYYCGNCSRRRNAENMAVKAYYDTVHIFCARGGCAK